jgi:hypothetical protein
MMVMSRRRRRRRKECFNEETVPTQLLLVMENLQMKNKENNNVKTHL